MPTWTGVFFKDFLSTNIKQTSCFMKRCSFRMNLPMMNELKDPPVLFAGVH